MGIPGGSPFYVIRARSRLNCKYRVSLLFELVEEGCEKTLRSHMDFRSLVDFNKVVGSC